MFIRWKRHKLKQRRRDFVWNERGEKVFVTRHSLRCELVESYRNKDGKPRLRTKRYLATIHENQIGSLIKRNTFWYYVNVRLAELRLTQDEEAKIRAMIEKRVPRPSAASVEGEIAHLAQ
jgi:hypothetical protein